MNNDSASLDRLHDIVTPSAVPCWPPAPGWYFLAAIVLLAAAVLAVRLWRNWQRTAHRREALRTLRVTTDTAAIAALLRRTALAEFPRSEIAALQGEAWVDWLATRSSAPVTSTVRKQLATGSYSVSENSDAIALREWAARWISSHHNTTT